MSQEDHNLSGGSRFRSILNISMGIIYLILGGVVIYTKYFGTMELGNGIRYALGGLMIVYGLFRLWRGFYEMKSMR